MIFLPQDPEPSSAQLHQTEWGTKVAEGHQCVPLILGLVQLTTAAHRLNGPHVQLEIAESNSAAAIFPFLWAYLYAGLQKQWYMESPYQP